MFEKNSLSFGSDMLRDILMQLMRLLVCAVWTVRTTDLRALIVLTAERVFSLFASLPTPVMFLLLCLAMTLAVLNLCVSVRWLVRWSTVTTCPVFNRPVVRMLSSLIVLLLIMVMAPLGLVLVVIVVN